MTTKRLYWLAIVVLCVSVLWIGRGVAQVDGGAVGKTAVCNIAQVFENYKRAKDLTADFEKRRVALGEEDARRQRAIESLHLQLDALALGSKAYEAKLSEIEEATLSREVWRKLEEGKLVREHLALTQEMYSDILRLIETVAKERGYELVLYRDELDLASSNRSELLSKIALRKVLYSSDAIDITDAVLKRLDSLYESRGN